MLIRLLCHAKQASIAIVTLLFLVKKIADYGQCKIIFSFYFKPEATIFMESKTVLHARFEL